MSKRPITYHIIGGGVSGLFCAQILKQKEKQNKVVVYEAGSCLGGRCHSFTDSDWDKKLDNATHVIIGANSQLRKYVTSQEWENDINFYDNATGNISKLSKKHLGHLLKSACNTSEENISSAIKKYILRQTFPYTKNKRKIYFSKQDLSQRIINHLASAPDEVLYNCRLNKIESQFGRAAQLVFNNRQVELGSEDKVILAIDNRSYSQLMNEPVLPHNSIINIFYHTSENLFLPQGASLIAVINGIPDWVFVSNRIVSTTISVANNIETPLPELARQIWQELDVLRGVNSAFIPPFKAYKHKYATISQDEYTNSLRPDNALSRYPNVFVAGDWTMKNHPCCLETAFISAQRAVKEARK
ncbi:MAG: hypothetical protein E7012_06915 [Alphaproteobacteria bacterium]|nr:hypothetical protein [Alphaproteobacteria bacterium]